MSQNILLGQYAYVYFMTNEYHTSLYIGVTTNLSKRISDHKNGYGSKFTSRYSLTKLVYIEGYSQISEAIQREKKLKTGSAPGKMLW